MKDKRVGMVVDTVPGTHRTITSDGRVAPIIYTAAARPVERERRESAAGAWAGAAPAFPC